MTVEPAEIDNSVPTEDEIAAAVKKLRRNRSGGPSRICAEHLKGWLTAAKRVGVAEVKGKKKTEAEEEVEEMWVKVVEMTQTAFREGKLAEEAAWQTVVRSPKGKGEFRGIGLVEVTWKIMAVILHRRRTTGLHLHDALHGFRDGTRRQKKEVRRPLKLRLSGSRWNELRCTAKYHPREKTSR